MVELDVKGLFCDACAYGVQISVSKLPGVENCSVSMQEQKATVVMAPGAEADLEKIKAAIVDAGFTPGEATVHAGTN